MISKSLPVVDHLFPSVLKLTSVQSVQVKTLVYLITLRLAPSQPDMALLSINSFQRDLTDSSPLIRGMALRVLSGLGVKMASQIMEMAIAKGVRDASFYVRRIAADAIGKCFELSRSSLDNLLPHLSTSLADRHPSVLGSALLAFGCTVPDRHDLLHPHFRRICHALVDIDEWNQPVALRVLATYVRCNFEKPSASQVTNVDDGRSEKRVPGRSRFGNKLDPDFELLLAKAEPLLCSRNAATVLSAAHLYLVLLGPQSGYLAQLTQPLLRLLRASPSQGYIVTLFVRGLVSLRPDVFRHSMAAFIPKSAIAGEPAYLSRIKLDILVDLAQATDHAEELHTEASMVLDELQESILHGGDCGVVPHAVEGLGRLALSQPRTLERCEGILLGALQTSRQRPAEVTQRIVSVLRTIVQKNATVQPGLVVRVLCSLASLLYRKSHKGSSESNGTMKMVGKSCITATTARASVFWMLGQYCGMTVTTRPNATATAENEKRKTMAEIVLPDVLRKAALNFVSEASEVKFAILAFSSKVAAFVSTLKNIDASLQRTLTQLHKYVMQLARSDVSLDVQDRARFYRNLSAGVTGYAQGEVGNDDDEVVPAGVRLRQEQVVKVLFEKSTSAVPGADNSRVDRPLMSKSDVDPDEMTRRLDPVCLLQNSMPGLEHQIKSNLLPSWPSDLSKVPPSSVRNVKDTTPVQALAPKSLASGSVMAQGSSSRSSSQGTTKSFPGGSKVQLAPAASASDAARGSGGTATPTTSSAPQGKGKYQDLDAFLDAESEEEAEESSESEDEQSTAESTEEDDDDDDDDDDIEGDGLRDGSERGGASGLISSNSSSSSSSGTESDDEEMWRRGAADTSQRRPMLPVGGNEWASS